MAVREQVRLCSGRPKVHFGTIVEGSKGEGGRGAWWVLRALSLIFVSHWEASHCTACLTASTSMVRLKVVSV